MFIVFAIAADFAAHSACSDRQGGIKPGRIASRRSAASGAQTRKWPENGPLGKQHPVTFLAMHGSREMFCAGAAATSSLLLARICDTLLHVNLLSTSASHFAASL
jgi:hypothetical protein